MAAVQVDRAQSDAMNLQVLKRQDDDVMEIVDTASHVVMYEFDQDNQNWVCTSRKSVRMVDGGGWWRCGSGYIRVD